VDRIYVGDLGGRLWRVDLVAGESPGTWSASLLADLGRRATGTAAGGADDRRFFHAPDVVQSSLLVDDGAGTVETVKFHAVLIGSGDRANPLHNAPANWFFMIRDTNLGVLSAPSDADYRMDDLEDVTGFTTVDAEIPTTSAGWKLRLVTPGEKSLASSLTVGNSVFFTTYIPPGAVATDVCGPAEGNGRLYAVSLKNAGPVFNRDAAVDGDESFDPSDRWTDLRAAGIPAEAQYIPAGNEGVVLVGVETIEFSTASRWRTFWYLEEDPVQ
jgi:type IV pilus assembly protein PilY1